MPTKTSVPRKPLIWGDDPLENERYDDLAKMAGSWDASYVPGYSELKRENALRVKDGKKPKPIPRLQWVRGTGRTGEDVSISDEGMIQWRSMGYRAVGLDDLESMGFGMPPTAHVAPDGTIRRQDLVLFFVDPNRAARNRENEDAARAEMRGESRAAPTHESLEVVDDTRAGATGKTLEDISKALPNL